MRITAPLLLMAVVACGVEPDLDPPDRQNALTRPDRAKDLTRQERHALQVGRLAGLCQVHGDAAATLLVSGRQRLHVERGILLPLAGFADTVLTAVEAARTDFECSTVVDSIVDDLEIDLPVPYQAVG